MRKPSLILVAVITAATITIGYLFLQLRAERNVTAQLRERLERLPAAIQPAGSAAPVPRLANQASPPAAPTVHDAPPTAPTPDAKRSAANPQRQSRSGTRIAEGLGLPEEDIDAFNRLHEIRGSSYADFVALLGPAKYEQYLEIRRADVRGLRVRRLRTALAATDFPLTDVQAAQVDSLLDTDLRRRAADDKLRAQPSDPRALLDYDDATRKVTQADVGRVIADARGFLSAEQAAVLESQLRAPLNPF